jgi:septal ring-binding cell division protein DamX
VIGNRRHNTRQTVDPPVYVSLGPRRGGLLNNLSVGGLAVEVQGVPLSGRIVPVVLDLTENQSCIETIGQIAWRDKLGTRAGLEFLDLSEISRQQITEWLSQRTLVGQHQRITTEPEVLEAGPFALPVAQDNMKSPVTPSEADDLMVAEQPPDSATSAYRHSIDLRSLVIPPGKTTDAGLREQKKAFAKEGPSGKSSQMILEARHALGLFAAIVVFLGLLFVLGYVLGRSQRALQPAAFTPVDKETLHPAEASSPPANRLPAASATQSSIEAPLIPPGAVVLQVAAVTRESEAVALVEALRHKDFSAFVLMPGADPYYRVLVGPYADTQSAFLVRRRLVNEGFKPILKR